MNFTAYSVATATISHGVCYTTTGPSVGLSGPYPVSFPGMESTDVVLCANMKFSEYLGLSVCQPRLAEAILTPTTIFGPTSTPSRLNTTASAVVSSTSVPVAHPSYAPPSGSGTHNTLAKVAIESAVPVAVLALVLLGLSIWYRRRKAHNTRHEEITTSQEEEEEEEEEETQEDAQPYLQLKPELEAEENRKHELEAQERRYEMGSQGERYELPAEQEPVTRIRQELRGEEHSKELEVPR